MLRTRRSIRSPLLAIIAALGTLAVHAIPVSTAAVAAGAEKHRSSIVAECAAELVKGRIRAQQRALATLAAQPGPEADQVLIEQFKRYDAGKLPPALWLDLFEAAARRDNADLKSRLAERERRVAASQDSLKSYRECLEGGDADTGREIFTKKPEAGCIRCHRAGGEGGQIGPDLATLHQTTERIFILESIVDPNAVIAPGFQNVLLTMKNGETVTGILNFETEDEVVITSVVDGKKRKLPAAEIKERTPLPSAMPPGFGIVLGKRAIRDLVQFLATME